MTARGRQEPAFRGTCREVERVPRHPVPMRLSRPVLCALALSPAPLLAQDVEMLGERYGTPVPAVYYDIKARYPGAFEFSTGRPLRLRQRMAALAAAGPAALLAEGARVLGPRDGPVVGDFRVPVVMGLFSDSPDSLRHSGADLQAAYFGSGDGAVSRYYAEVSGGRVSLIGDVFDWVRAPEGRSRFWVTNGSSGLQSRTHTFIRDILTANDGVDWGLYDNDGPDGVPNSGDDDGLVDALAVIQPTAGAECGGSDSENRIWSHKWSLAVNGAAPFQTSTPAAGGGFVRVNDYFIQPVFSCNETDLAEIGVFAHEAGHAFGLPDLYDTVDGNGRHQGAGNWDLMASGSWGCDNDSPGLPCHMGAWSKVMLGWADVVDVPSGTDLGTVVLPPVESSGVVYRVEAADASGEYFLLENRQRIGFDARLHGDGLLVWQIDPDWIAERWPRNRVNGDDHMGVWLRQADGLEELGFRGGGRGDADDPFPGQADGFDMFHADSRPASLSFERTPTAVTLAGIRRSGEDIELRLLNRFARVTVRSEGTDGGVDLFQVDGATVAGPTPSFLFAPFEPHEIGAAAGEVIEPGRRRPFLEWMDDAAAERERSFVTPMTDVELVARYSPVAQVELAFAMTGGVNDVTPATLTTDPASEDLWFPEGTLLQLRIDARTGFAFRGWTGDLAGAANPAALAMDRPRTAGADFELVYRVAEAQGSLEAGIVGELPLVVEHGNAPVFWSRVDGALPDGLRFDVTGKITGAALETGSYPITVEALDAIGLTARGTVTLEVVEPQVPLATLAAPFLLAGPIAQSLGLYLDREGNGDGAYDLGDLRAWVLAHPNLPITGALRALVAAPPPTDAAAQGDAR